MGYEEGQQGGRGRHNWPHHMTKAVRSWTNTTRHTTFLSKNTNNIDGNVYGGNRDGKKIKWKMKN